jgi:hypothetical protein
LNEFSEVWCLTVPEGGEYALADGSIVHNSNGADAFRYLSLVAQRGSLAPKPQKTPEKLDLRPKITLDQLYEERDKSAPRLSLVRRRI